MSRDLSYDEVITYPRSSPPQEKAENQSTPVMIAYVAESTPSY